MARQPTPLSQLDAPQGSKPQTLCGPTVLAMVGEVAGVPDSPAEEGTDVGHTGPTSGDELMDVVEHDFHATTERRVSDARALEAVQNEGAYAVFLIRDDDNAQPNPNGPNEHWILAWAATPNGFNCNNPWPVRGAARSYFYGLAVLQAAVLENYVIHLAAVPVSTTQPTTGGQPARRNTSMGATLAVPGFQARFKMRSGHIFESWYEEATEQYNGPVDLTAAFFVPFAGPGCLASDDPSCAVTDGGDQIVDWTGVDGHTQWHAWYDGGSAPRANPPRQPKWNGPIAIPGW